MSNAKDPKTDRELLLSVVSRLDSLGESMKRIAEAVEKLENHKLTAIDIRIDKLELWKANWDGVWKLVSIAGVVIGIISIFLRWI